MMILCSLHSTYLHLKAPGLIQQGRQKLVSHLLAGIKYAATQFEWQTRD